MRQEETIPVITYLYLFSCGFILICHAWITKYSAIIDRCFRCVVTQQKNLSPCNVGAFLKIAASTRPYQVGDWDPYLLINEGEKSTDSDWLSKRRVEVDLKGGSYT